MAIRTRWQPLVFASLLVWGTVVPAARSQAASPGRQSLVAYFEQPTLVWAGILEGAFLIVHDDARALRGEACTLVYRLDGLGKASEETLSFPCIPNRRSVADRDKVTTRWDPRRGLHEMTEFQFAGDSEAHRVPGCEYAANGLGAGLLVLGR